ncbi:hypothetical protein JCM15415_18250 [Methanobacterium movens]
MRDNAEKLAHEYYEVKEKIRALENKRQRLRSSLFHIFDTTQYNEFSTNELKVYRINRPRITWDEKKLERILIEKGLLYQVLSPDPKKVKELISQGLISDKELEKAKIAKDSWYMYAERLSKKKSFHPLHLKEKNYKYSQQEPESSSNLNNEYLGSQTLIITDLSRMKDDRVCICGVDSQGTTIRPVLPYGVRERNLVDKKGRPIIKPFAVVNFELLKAKPQAPHSEDVRWDLIREPKFIRKLSLEERKELMDELAFNRVQEIFSAPILENRFIKEDAIRSIGTLKPEEIIELIYENNYGESKYRMVFGDNDYETFNLPVTDLAFRDYFNKKLENGYSSGYIADELLDKFEKNDSFLRLGLTRKFKDVYWIQITGAYTFPYYTQV